MTEKITPETYEKMNEEFEKEGLAFTIKVPTQEEIDEWHRGVRVMTEKEIPWGKLHEIKDKLNGTLRHIICIDHTGRNYKRIVIEYEEQK